MNPEFDSFGGGFLASQRRPHIEEQALSLLRKADGFNPIVPRCVTQSAPNPVALTGYPTRACPAALESQRTNRMLCMLHALAGESGGAGLLRRARPFFPRGMGRRGRRRRQCRPDASPADRSRAAATQRCEERKRLHRRSPTCQRSPTCHRGCLPQPVQYALTYAIQNTRSTLAEISSLYIRVSL